MARPARRVSAMTEKKPKRHPGIRIRTTGSGNIGATNVLRTGNKKLAAGTLLLDALKATAAALIGWYAFGPEAGLVASVFIVLGTVWMWRTRLLGESLRMRAMWPLVDDRRGGERP